MDTIGRRGLLKAVLAAAALPLEKIVRAATPWDTDKNKDGITNFYDYAQAVNDAPDDKKIQAVKDTSENWLKGYTVIRTAQDLQNIKDNLSGTYVLANDIDLQGFDFEPIGSDTHPFTGNLHGNGYSIRNLTINRRSEDRIGLFRFLDGGALVDNLSMENVNLVGMVSVGPLAAEARNASLYRIFTSGTIEARSENGGGVIGKFSKGLIEDSYSDCEIIGLQYLGGIIGAASGASTDSIVIAKCYSKGNVNADWFSSGGIVGLSRNMTATDCYSTGVMTALASAGGIIGENQGNTVVNNSYYTNTTNDSGLGTLEPLGADAFKGEDHSHPVYGTVETPIWDFEKVWQAYADALPTLRRESQPTPAELVEQTVAALKQQRTDAIKLASARQKHYA